MLAQWSQVPCNTCESAHQRMFERMNTGRQGGRGFLAFGDKIVEVKPVDPG